jgi:peptide/nickel transport system ATP-binding protein
VSGFVLKAEGLTKIFRPTGRRGTPVVAVRDVSLTLAEGDVLGVVGESGSGKTTLGRMLVGIEPPTAGRIQWGAGSRGQPRQRVQMVFQDPYAALNPFNRLSYTLTRPLINYRHLSAAAARRAAAELLATVELTPPEAFLDKRPHQLSGGQRQRVVIARALAAQPDVIVADEPVSMLDVSIRADVLTLLRDLLAAQRVRALLYITHDLLSARLLAQQVLVLYRGHVVERGPTAAILAAPRHPYTRLLWSAIPNPRRERRGEAAAWTPARPGAPTTGCPFAPRCPWAEDRCVAAPPPLVPQPDGRAVACYVMAPPEAAAAVPAP